MPVLVIVESGAKGPKIEKMLGKGYQVRGCYGHMQDIPHNLKWIEAHAKGGWDPETIPYVESPTAKKTISSLRGLAKKASKIIIASDMDREGEAIGYHIRDLLRLKASKKPVERIVFDQITPEAIQNAIENPTELRESLYRAQQARRVIDILFGYTVSPLLWHIRPNLSAGRCQSPALRWLHQRQEEFMALTILEPKHNIVADLADPVNAPNGLLTTKYIDQRSTGSLTNKHSVLEDLQDIRQWHLSEIASSKTKQSPPQPLTTSAMQQKCYNRFKWSAKQTNAVAQKLYEAGHITYIRTDCKALSASFVKQARAHLLQIFGEAYVADGTFKKTRKSKTQALAQEAHEPIRPVNCDKRSLTDAECHAMHTDAKHARMLYALIYETTMSSLMVPCVLDKYVLTFRPHPTKGHARHHTLHKELTYIFFPGFRVWEVSLPFEPQTCPYFSQQVFPCARYVSEVKHPLPIRPYSSGELLKALESNGIGRPSTYSSIIERLEIRKYIEYKKGNSVSPWQRALLGHPITKTTNEEITIDMRPKTPKRHSKSTPTDIVSLLGDRYFVTTIGREATHYLVAQQKLKELTETHFTQELETRLDAITQGKATYTSVVKAFYEDLMQSTKGLKRAVMSGVDSFRNHPTKRLLEEHADHYYVAMDTQNGEAVALLYKNAKRKKDAVFANIPTTASVKTVTLAQAKALIAERAKQNKTNGGDKGKLLGTQDSKTVYAKTGRFGPYLIWTDASQPHLQEQTVSFVNKSVGIDDVTLAQAVEWIGQAKLTLRKVNATFTIKYNPKYDSVYLSRPNPTSKGRPLCVPLPDISKDEVKAIQAMKVKDCQALFDEKLRKKTPPKKPKRTKQTQKN